MVEIHHYPTRLDSQAARVVIRPFHIAAKANDARALRIVTAVLALTEDECANAFAAVNEDFSARHWQARGVYLDRFAHVAAEMDLPGDLSEGRRLLIGAYFCHEYSYAAAAVMNPSVVPHPDQTGLMAGDQRFIMSVRTVGEGHISSISFREGIVSANGDLKVWPPPAQSIAVESDDPVPTDVVMAHRPSSVPISGTIIFPFTPAQRNGLEDLRLVRFVEDDGEVTYYGTYTAYSGSAIRSELLTTKDFTAFKLEPIDGDASRSKGFALFPRRIDGGYAMIGRQDHESLFFMRSDDLTHWSGGEKILAPEYVWELVQIGNCGAPIELDEGWLLLTHGVGAMRKYCIGAALLDKKDPRKVLAKMATPLMSPSDGNREGYVPNVLYTCGAMKHGKKLFLPYAIADSAVSFAMVDLPSLLKAMT